MNALEIQNVFQSRVPAVRGGKGLYDWYAQMIISGVLRVSVEDYDASSAPPATLSQSRGNESSDHIALTHWARLAFPEEGRTGGLRDMLGYGTCDIATAVRVIECGNTPPVKLLRSWAIGFQTFTVFPFPHLLGHKHVTFSPTCVPWPLKPPSGFRVRHGCKTIGGEK